MPFKFSIDIERDSALWKTIHVENIEALNRIDSRGGGLLTAEEVVVQVLLNSEKDALKVRSSFLEKFPKENSFLAFIQNDDEIPRYWFVFSTKKSLDVESLTDIEYLMTISSASLTSEKVVWELERKS